MRYQVPQFIEIEDKIFGPLTLRQFIYLAGGGGICLVFFSLLPIYLTVILAIPVIALSAGLAFYQVNGRPLIDVLEHAFGYMLGHKLYLWKAHKDAPDTGQPVAKTALAAPPSVPKLSESRLKDLAWSLNIKDRAKMDVADTGARTGFEI